MAKAYHANCPQILHGIPDSPVGLAEWVFDHHYDPRSRQLIARIFDGKVEGFTCDDVLDDFTLWTRIPDPFDR